MKTRSNRFWALVLGGALALCLVLAAILSRGGRARPIARVDVDGVTLRRIDLSAVTQEYTFDVQTPEGVNTIAVRPGGIRVVSADCPDGVCVQRGWLESGRMPIVCLPHRLVITLEADAAEDGFDAVAG